MSKLIDYYNRQKDDWSDKELEDVRTEYETKEMTISQIGDIHHRTPGSISYKIQKMGIITHNTQSRGYLDYKNSNLYKQIVSTNKSIDSEKKINKEVPSVIFREILEMRHEIIDLKKDVKEMLSLINNLYDFVSQKVPVVSHADII